MIDIWVNLFNFWAKLVADQFELALNLTRTVFGINAWDAPVSVHTGSSVATIPDQDAAISANSKDELAHGTDRQEKRFAAVMPGKETLLTAAQVSGSAADEPVQCQIGSQTSSARPGAAIIPFIIFFLESADGGATVRQIAEHLEKDKKIILPLLKALVKERRIDELLGRYYVLKS